MLGDVVAEAQLAVDDRAAWMFRMVVLVRLD